MWRQLAVGVAVWLASSMPGLADARDLAIIVNPENPVHELSFRDLVKIFRQERKFWDTGSKIYLLLRDASAPERDIALRKIYRMDEEELKRYWLLKLNQEEISVFPQALASNEAVKRFVSHAPNAIGFIDASLVDDRVKVLRIDGSLPGQPGYTLSDSF